MNPFHQRLFLALLLACTSFIACNDPCESVPDGSLGDLTSWEHEFLKQKKLPSGEFLLNSMI